MAKAPTPATSKTSITAVVGVRVPGPPPLPLPPHHEPIYSRASIEEDEYGKYICIPLVNTDPYGFEDKIPRRLVEDGSCPLCRSIDVSNTQDVHCSWEKQLTQALINPFILLAVLRRVKVPGPSPVLPKKEEVALPLKDE